MYSVEFFPNAVFDETVETHIVRERIYGSPSVEFRTFETYVEAALVRSFRQRAFFFAKRDISVYRAVKISDQFLSISPFIGNERTYTENLSEKDSVRFGEFNAPYISPVFDSIFHMRPSLANTSVNCLI